MTLPEPELMALLLSAAGIAFTHTLMGPDHYLPFVAIAVERRWSWGKLLGVTLMCAAAHLVGSVLLLFAVSLVLLLQAGVAPAALADPGDLDGDGIGDPYDNCPELKSKYIFVEDPNGYAIEILER